jgi:hypothetical protein
MSEFSKHIADARAKGWPEGARRMEMERRMASALVKACFANGGMVSIHNGEEWAIRKSRNYRSVMDALWQCDEEHVVAHRADGTRAGSFYLVYGNDGYDLVADYTANEFCNEIWDKVLSPLSDKLCLAG